MTEKPITPRSDIPAFHELFNPVLDAVRQLGGSASNSEIEEQIIADLNFREDILEFHKQDNGQPTLRARLSWTKDYLKRTGYLESTKRGVWGVTNVGRDTQAVDTQEIRQLVRSQSSQSRETQIFDKDAVELEPEESNADVQAWRTELLEILHTLTPNDFESLCQLMLKESGFTDVSVTGRSGDGGIDGNGKLLVGGLVGFPVLFQCKRWRNSVPVTVVRDFQGALQGRADRGFIITTSTFTSDARKEAKRDGASPIDLINGDALLNRLKDLELGVSVVTKTVEETNVDKVWWQSRFRVSP